MTLCSQVCLLMWKNWLIQKRRLAISIFEVILPALFSCLLPLVRDAVTPSFFPNLTYFENETIVTHPSFFPKDGIIGYAPASNATTDVMSHVFLLLMRNMPPSQNLSLKGFTTEKESVTFYEDNVSHIQHIVVFHGVDSKSNLMPKKVSFSILPHLRNKFWYTNLMYPFLDNKMFERRQIYTNRAVLYLQSLVGEALARYWTEKAGRNPDSIGFEVYSKSFVCPPYREDLLANLVQSQLPLYLILSFMLSVVIGTKNIVTEKEKKLKESMKLMGLTSTAYWLSWYLTLLVYLVPVMAMYTMMFSLPVSSGGPVLFNTNGSLFFVILLVYAHALITYCSMISTLVQK
ncbi:unnamed protein product, partial [Candidula unifasciata]